MSAKPLPFDELFRAVELNSLSALHALILAIPTDLAGRETVFNLLNQAHPQRKLTVLQLAVGRYPNTSLRLIEVLLEYGAGTELPINWGKSDPAYRNILVTPLWIAVKLKVPVQVIRLLLNYKADILFKCTCTPFYEGDKKSIEEANGFTLLHLAAKIEADEQVFRILLDGSSRLLLNDQSNHLKQTPLMIAVKQKNVFITKLLLEADGLNVELLDSDGLTAYEIAAKERHLEICSLFPLKAAYNYVLEIVETDANNEKQNHETDDLLPIDGYWEWIDEEWTSDAYSNNKMCRLRKRTDITDQLYLRQSIDLVRQSSPQKGLTILLVGLQHETNPQKKMRAARYFQRLLQKVERGGMDALGLLDNLSRSNLVILDDKNNNNNNNNKPVLTQRDFNAESESEVDSDDSLLYCPVCSYRFPPNPPHRSAHLQSCLTQPRHKLIGNRYTNVSKVLGRGEEECPICYEEMKGDAVVMNCLCRFHGKCIEEWLQRGKHCPYHSE